MTDSSGRAIRRDSGDGGLRSVVSQREKSRQQLSSVVRVPIAVLQPSDSPRLSGENIDHACALAETDEALPPIIVDRSTMRVIDGMHRLRAMALRGLDEVDVQFFDGDERDAFVLSVELNIRHGLPLSMVERTSAAARIIESHPHWSDRAIASSTGLAAKTVGAIRRRSSEENLQLNARVGRDGRVRPLNTAEGRRIASELILQEPGASLRDVATAAGISLGTAQDVRRRLRHGEDPLPEKQRHSPDPRVLGSGSRGHPHGNDARRSGLRRSRLLHALSQDPSLRSSEVGRTLLRLLQVLTLESSDWQRLLERLPAHCLTQISTAARASAEAWHEFAEQVERG